MPAPIPFDFDKHFNSHNEILDYIFQKPGANSSLYASKDIADQENGVYTEIILDPEEERSNLRIELEEYQLIKNTELEAVAICSGDNCEYEKAHELLSGLIHKYPNYASAYNNRAQVYQYQAAVLLQQPVDEADTETAKKLKSKADMIRIKALSDLNQALMLTYQLYPQYYEKNIEEAMKRSDETTKLKVPLVLVQSLCQRGILHRVRGNFQQYRLDIAHAARLGSRFAQSELVEMNPIAQLNMEYLPEIMKQLQH